MSEEYFKVNTKIIDNYGSILPAPVIQTYIGLLRHADNRGIVSDEKTQAQWSDAIGVGRTTFIRSVSILKDEGLIQVVKPKNPVNCNGYIIKDPGEAKPFRSKKRKLFIDYKNGRRNDI